MERKGNEHTADGRVGRERGKRGEESDVLARCQVRNEGMVFLMTCGDQSLMGGRSS